MVFSPVQTADPVPITQCHYAIRGPAGAGSCPIRSWIREVPPAPSIVGLVAALAHAGLTVGIEVAGVTVTCRA